MSQLKVNTIRHTGASSDAVTLATDGTCTVKATNKSNRNLVINGAMNVAQRGTSSTGTSYGCVDRFANGRSGPAVTQTQHTLTSSDTGPWAKGFRNSYMIHVTDPQTPDATTDYCEIVYQVEAQDIVHSGWDYTNASSYITISFWVKSTVAGTYSMIIKTNDGATNYRNWTFNYTLSADTWTKVTHSLPGHASQIIDNDNGAGLTLHWVMYYGTNYTASKTNEQWMAHTSGNQVGDFAQNILATDEAKFEITGVQLEAGDVATDFEHRSYGDELARCQRYYQKFTGISYRMFTKNVHRWGVPLPVKLRAVPTATKSYTSTTNMGNDHTTSADGTMLNYSLSTDPSGSDNIIDNGGGTITLDSEL